MAVPDRIGRPWVCLWATIIDAERFDGLSDGAGWLYTRLYALVGVDGEAGRLRRGFPSLARRLKVGPKLLASRLAELAARDLVSTGDDWVSIVDWPREQAEETGAERKRRLRAEAKAQRELGDDSTEAETASDSWQSADPVRTTAARCPDNGRLELEKEQEREKEQDIDIPAHREGSGPERETSTAASVFLSTIPRPIRRTDAELRPLFDAFCRGANQRLTWRAQQILPTERIALHAPTVSQVERAAARYAGTLSGDIVASYRNFAADFDRWLSAAETKPHAKPDDPRLGISSAASRPSQPYGFAG